MGKVVLGSEGIVQSALSRQVVSVDGVMDGCAVVVSSEMSAGEMLLAFGCRKRLFVRCGAFVVVCAFLNLGGKCFLSLKFFCFLLRVGCSLEMTYFS